MVQARSESTWEREVKVVVCVREESGRASCMYRAGGVSDRSCGGAWMREAAGISAGSEPYEASHEERNGPMIRVGG